MEKKVLSYNQFLIEQEGETTPSGDLRKDIKGPETEREAKSRIAKGIVQSIFGDIKGITGGVDSKIEQTPEVKDSLPYKGCGINDPYNLPELNLPVSSIKIILDYLNNKKVADYSNSIKELNEKRALIVGVRNYLNLKKESANQDRFCDYLYFIPSSADQGTWSSGSPITVSSATGSTGTTGSTGSALADSSKKNKTSDDPLARLGKGKKNESISIDHIEEKIDELNNLLESDLLGFDEFQSINRERNYLESQIDLLKRGISIDEDYEYVSVYEQGTGSTGSTGATGTSSLGDTIKPYQITTVPSLAYYGKKPLNPKGVGIKMPGDTLYLFQESSLSKEKYKMLVEGHPIKVGRYPIGVTKFESYSPPSIETESCGMQIHRSSTKGEGVCVGPWSAGCQVFSDFTQWKEFISKLETEKMNANKFMYALIQLDDIPKDILDNALKGISPLQDEYNRERAKEEEEKANAEAEAGSEKEESDAEKMNKEYAKSQKDAGIKDLAELIHGEKESFSADEEKVIKKYNSIIKSDGDWKKLVDVYKSEYDSDLWDDMDNFLTSGEFKELKFKA